MHAISTQFSKVRSFVFIDGLDEVTDYFDGVDDPAEAVARITAEADVVAFDGHSDYGRALSAFHDEFADSLTRRSTILLLGDARSNYHAPHPEVLADLRGTAPRRSTGSTPSRTPTGTAVTRSCRPTPRTATGSSSAGRCASSRRSSAA